MVEVVDQLDLSPFIKAYRGSGSPAHHPSVLLGLLIYGYAREVYSSRKLERATYDPVAFRFIAANDHRDHDTIATFRRRFLTEIEQLFVDVLLLARQAGILKLGTVALDGKKIHADASQHSALSWKRACEIGARLRPFRRLDGHLLVASRRQRFRVEARRNEAAPAEARTLTPSCATRSRRGTPLFISAATLSISSASKRPP